MECDPSIKSIILRIDADDHAFIVEELDDQTLVVKETMVNLLKQKLQEVDITRSNLVARLTQDCSTSRQRSKSHSFLAPSREARRLQMHRFIPHNPTVFFCTLSRPHTTD